MKYFVAGVSRNIQITTVTLSHDIDDIYNENMYVFHCIRCGTPILQYQGFVASIMPGLAPIKLPTILRCRNSKCKHSYSFQTIV